MTLASHQDIVTSWPHRRTAVARIWKGRTPAARADEYAAILQKSCDLIASKQGNLGVQMFRNDEGDVAHFMVISYWPAMEAMRTWSGGDDVRRVHHLPEDMDFLLELPEFVEVYELQHNAWVTRAT
ncbi:antibiotic biosynthesis monooxygenase [Ferrovibrio sp.]|jgi:heme-degrading monooxygenase HmoA|uniref:antibiotic biosynthesis monooxygenase family protein n=1 Tax=Ferrovibrio sp. TaxID=1917215 RepID=UPI0035B0ECC0